MRFFLTMDRLCRPSILPDRTTGVPWQPPWSYALVTRELPFAFADRLMAVFVCLGLTKLNRDLSVRKQNLDISMRLSITEKEQEITERVEALTSLISRPADH